MQMSLWSMIHGYEAVVVSRAHVLARSCLSLPWVSSEEQNAGV